jgi:hypothetical protein
MLEPDQAGIAKRYCDMLKGLVGRMAVDARQYREDV